MKIFGYDISIKKNKVEKKGAYPFDGFTNTQKQLLLQQMGSGTSIDAYGRLWVYARCVMMIADDVAALPYQVQDNKGNKIPNDDKFNKFFMNPNEMDTGRELIRSIVSYYLSSEGGYIWKNFGGMSTDYYVLKSQGVDVIGDNAIIENILRYKYTNNGKTQIYMPEDILHMKSFNPDSRIIGQSRLKAATNEVRLLNKMNTYQNALYDNKAAPSGNFTTNDILSPDERIRVKKSIREQYQGSANAGEIMVLEKGLEFKSIAFNPTDLGILKSEIMNESAVATLMGVPIEKLGALAEKKNVSNYKESDRAYMNDTVLPIGNIIATMLNRDFYSQDKVQYRKITIPKSQIDELKPTNEDLKEQYWTTPNQKLAMQGLNESKDELMDKVYIPSSLIEISDLNELPDNSEL